MESVQTVVGAGQAGLSVSHLLAELGHEHVVLERGDVGETGRRERWDSFRLNTPARWLHLPGREYRGDASDSFLIRDEAVGYFEGYAAEKPRQRRGCAEVDGLYFVGLHWLHKRKSTVLVGVAEDAEHRAVRLSASHR